MRKGRFKSHPEGPQVAAPIDLVIQQDHNREVFAFFRPLCFNHKMSYLVDESKIQLENFSRTGQKKKEMKMGKSNYWTIWCPISQFVEHFDFLAHIYILLLQNKVRDTKSLNASIQQARNYRLTFKNSHILKRPSLQIFCFLLLVTTSKMFQN